MNTFEAHPLQYPNILGTSFAGTVVSTGPNVTKLKPGGRVATLRGSEKLNDSRFGAYQRYALTEAAYSSKLLPGTSLESGAATIFNIATIASALSVHLGLHRPTLTGPTEPKKKKVLIYGGSSPSGGLAIKYAATGGYTVVTTSSPRNRDFVKSLAPAYIVDHTAPADTVEEEIRQQGPYDAILDTIGLPPVTNLLVKYLSSIDGGGYNVLIPLLGGEDPIPENVQRRFAAYGWAFEEESRHELSRWLFKEYVPEGLESGLILPTRTQVVEGGLANVQHALDLMGQGAVSGYKLIMYP